MFRDNTGFCYYCAFYLTFCLQDNITAFFNTLLTHIKYILHLYLLNWKLVSCKIISSSDSIQHRLQYNDRLYNENFQKRIFLEQQKVIHTVKNHRKI